MGVATIKMINKSDNPIPKYETPGSAGFDIKANEDKTIFSGETQLIGTGLFFEIEQGYEVQVRSRSGLSLKGIVVANSPGTVDSDYRGEVKVILRNDSSETFIVNKGDRIAQGVVAKCDYAAFKIVDELEETVRGEGGFGHTGQN